MVLKSLLRSVRAIEPELHFAPDGERIYAIGDIHGRLDLLDELLARIEADDRDRKAARTTLIFLGDLIDRGPDSRAVVERVMALRGGQREVRFLKGNHEELLLRSVAGDAKATRIFIRVGGRETILSYGIPVEAYNDLEFEDLAALLPGQVPAEHVAFLDSFEDWIVKGDYLFVHAGVRPGVAIDEQSVADLRWIRNDFLDCRDPHGKMVVHGHSITDDVDLCPNRIGIDTGAYATGRLTAIGLEGADRWFLST